MPAVPFTMSTGSPIDQLHLSAIHAGGVEKFCHFGAKYKFLSRISIANCKAIETMWKTLNFSVENCVENLYKTRHDRGKGN